MGSITDRFKIVSEPVFRSAISHENALMELREAALAFLGQIEAKLDPIAPPPAPPVAESEWLPPRISFPEPEFQDSKLKKG